MKRRRDIDDLRERIELQEDAAGFQIRKAQEAPALTPDQVEIADYVIDFVLSLNGHDMTLLAMLKKHRYHPRAAARDAETNHVAAIRMLRRMPGLNRKPNRPA